MISAGEVGAVFAIVDEASPVLRLLIEQFERLDALIGRTKEQLSSLRMPTGAARAIAEMDASLAKLPVSTDKAVASMATGFGRLGG